MSQRGASPFFSLGIETSCDETAAAIVTDEGRIVAHQIHSQIEKQKVFGGVVPSLAAHEHTLSLPQIVDSTLAEAGLSPQEIDLVGVTAGPGLIGGVLVGVMFAKGFAWAAQKPLLAVNHLEGHALIPRLTNHVLFPYLLLLMSGGHTQILVVRGVGDYILLGKSLDDAAGECFDKVARVLGLPYPGGPAIEAKAQEGHPKAYVLPRPLKGRQGCDFSFSGLKTAVLNTVQGKALTTQHQADMAASFQQAVADCLVDRITHAIVQARDLVPGLNKLVISGGVAANRFLFGELSRTVVSLGLEVIAPPPALCTDNGVMIAWAAFENYRAGKKPHSHFKPRARWPLGEEISCLT